MEQWKSNRCADLQQHMTEQETLSCGYVGVWHFVVAWHLVDHTSRLEYMSSQCAVLSQTYIAETNAAHESRIQVDALQACVLKVECELEVSQAAVSLANTQPTMLLMTYSEGTQGA